MKYITPLLACLLLVACAQTTITEGSSFTDPGWNGVTAQSVLVEVQNAPLDEQQAIEESVTAILTDRNIRAQASYTLFMPTRDYTQSQRKTIMKDSGYETRLVIHPHDRDIISYYTPPATYPFGSATYGSGGHGSVGVGINFDKGYRYDEPVVHYKSDLYVIKDDHKIWTSDYSTRGVDGMSYEEVGKRFAKELVGKLEQDGIIPPSR